MSLVRSLAVVAAICALSRCGPLPLSHVDGDNPPADAGVDSEVH